MAKPVGNYYQHIMRIIKTADNGSWEHIHKLLGDDSIKASSLPKTLQRGNLPGAANGEIFYDAVISALYNSPVDLKVFASRLYLSLKKDNMIPDEYADDDTIDGKGADFNTEAFRTFIVHILGKDAIEKDLHKKTDKNTKNEPSALQDDEDTVKHSESPAAKSPKENEPSSPLELSSRFFTKGARSIVSLDDAEFERELCRLSELFKSITTFEATDAPPQSDNLIADLSEWIGDDLLRSPRKEVLKVKGPLGSYKNRLMQYLYLDILRRHDFVTPIYIDVASYERAAEDNGKIDEEDFITAFKKDLQAAEKIAAKAPDKKPLLILDGIRAFALKNETLYNSIAKCLKGSSWYLIVCMDTDFTMNEQNRYAFHPLVANNYDGYMRIRSMNLNRRAESIAFIRNCVNMFGVRLTPDRSVDKASKQVYDNLVRLNFLTLDAYWLTYILSNYQRYIFDPKTNNSVLYNAICNDFLTNRQLFASAAEFAFEFEFGGKGIDTNPYFDLRWLLIRKHRSVLDFLIASHYINKLSELRLVKGDANHNSQQLSFFNMVMPRCITRFVVTMLRGNEGLEKNIMNIADNYYDQLNLFGKSELTFWMARLKDPSRNRECVRLLQSYKKKELARYNNDNLSPDEKRNIAFLLRGINVSLIYKENKEALRDYLQSLLEDKLANSINRGFHLEYYGDKPYIPSKSLLDFEDDVTVGESTFTVLCLSLNRGCLKKNGNVSFVTLLEIMTLCNLIQARLEQGDLENVFDVNPYVNKCINYLKAIINQRTEMPPNVRVYFRMMHDELVRYRQDAKENPEQRWYDKAAVYNKYSAAASIERNGWCRAEIPHPENIVEHMYNCWLLGMLYLPDTYGDPDYDKTSILQMLLLHDLGEAETGDINRLDKQRHRDDYDHRESLVMNKLFLSGTYPGAADLSKYLALWNNWAARDNRGINARIAKDIDNIQTIYQFCTYYLSFPEKFPESELIRWLDGTNDILTDVGKEITGFLILENRSFKEIIEKYNSFYLVEGDSDLEE